jgi:hypothetical protein
LVKTACTKIVFATSLGNGRMLPIEIQSKFYVHTIQTKIIRHSISSF